MIAKLTAFLALADAACSKSKLRSFINAAKKLEKEAWGVTLHKCPGNKLHSSCQLKCKKGGTSKYGSVNCEGEITHPTCQ